MDPQAKKTRPFKLAAHGSALMGCDGTAANLRQVRNETLLLNNEAWRALDPQDRSEWYMHLSAVGHQIRNLADPRISSWNVGPHGFRGGREEIFALFEQGDPIICLQDLQIPKRKVQATKNELHALFPHYWIFISTAIRNGAGSQDHKGKHYNFTTLTAIDSHYFPSASHLSLHPGYSKGSRRGGSRLPPTAGRSLSITTKTKNGGKLHIINLYQYTANEGGEQDEIWELIRIWNSRHPGERVILIGDLNGSIPGGRHNFKHPMEKNLADADARLQRFYAKAKGTIWTPKEYTWKRGDKRAKLDHGICWNLPLTEPRSIFNLNPHQRYDHSVISFGLPAEEFARKPQPSRRPLAPTDKIDAVFFQNHIQKWQEAIQEKMLPASDEIEGEKLMEMQRADQETMKEEILRLQLREAKAKRRAKERQPGRSKEQTAVRRRHSYLAAAYVDAISHKDHEKTTFATNLTFKHMGLGLMSDEARKVIRGMANWASALRVEIKKHRDLLTKLEEKHHKKDSQRKASAQQHIFEFGIKGVRRVLRKHGTITTMREVYWECPIGFRWAWRDADADLADRPMIQGVLTSLQTQMRKMGEKYSLQIDKEGIEVTVETLTHMKGLLEWATTMQDSQLNLQPSLVLSKGPWRDQNLVAAAESFFQTNAYHPFATCIHGHTGPIPMSQTDSRPGGENLASGQRNITHFCPHEECNSQDPLNFRSNRSAVRDVTFLEEAGIFTYRTIDRGEKIGYPVATFREFNLFVSRMAN